MTQPSTLHPRGETAANLIFRSAPALRLEDIRQDFAHLLAASPGRALGRSDQGPLMGVAAISQGLPVGLILLQPLVAGRRVHVPVWVVAASWRGRGVGRRLLQQAELLAREQGYRFIQVGFEEAWPGAAAVRRLIQVQGWENPVELLHHFRFFQAEYRQPGWFRDHPLPPGVEPGAWGSLAETERKAIAERGRRGWYPQSLSPFQDPQRLEPLNSLVLRARGEIAGWMITHRIDESLIRYTALFVDPGPARLGYGGSLFLHAWERQLAARVPEGIFSVEIANRPALRFVERRLAPWVRHASSYSQSQKELVP